MGYIAGQRFAAGAGVSTVLPDLDFETYSEAGFLWDETRQKWGSLPGGQDNKRGLPTCGLHAYVEHPTFEVLSLAYDLKDGVGKRHWKPGDAPPLDLLQYVVSGNLLEAWNVAFELKVWNSYCVPTFHWPPLCEDSVRCAMSKARAFAMPGKLADAGRVLGIEHQKDPDGERLIKNFTMPCNPTKTKPRRRRFLSEEPDEALRMYAYNIRDIMAEEEASLKCPDLPPYELSVWQCDQEVNRIGVQIDTFGLGNCISIVEQAYAKYGDEFRSLTGGIEPSEAQKILGWLHGRGCHLDSLEWEVIDKELRRVDDLVTGGLVHPSEIGPEFRVLQLRAMLGAASVKKLWAIRNALSPEQRLHGLFIYFSAHTGRWAGMGPQPQNLYKGELIKSPEDQERAFAILATRDLATVEREYGVGNAIELVACCIRGLFVAKPGCDLVSSDFSAIEGVVAACLAGEQWRIEVFKTHGKIYEMSASKTSGVPFEEFLDHKKRTNNHHPLRNGLGKLQELSGGFGAWIAGWKRFGADKVLGSDDNIKRAILAWRDASPAIVEMWGGQTRGRFDSARPELYGLEGAAIAAVKWPGQAFGYRGIVYEMKGDILYCRVPSGGFIHYHAPRLQPSRRFEWTPSWELSLSYEGWNSNPQSGELGWARKDLYGGKLFENVVQRVARDFQCNAMLNVRAAGYRVVLHSHDELVAEVPLGFGSVEDFEAHANRLPSWAVLPDGSPWPVKMKGGWRGPRYGKFD